jgi:hypothetical protein
MKSNLRVLGEKIQTQLKKILEFFSINNDEYALVMGDNDVFRVRSYDTNKTGEDNKTIRDNILDEGHIGGTEILDYSHEETMITNLLIINAIMHRFKKIFIFGKLALQFIQFLRQDYELFDNSLYGVNEKLFQLMKYILVKAYLLKIEIILPDDFKILDKEEFKKHISPYTDQNGQVKDYTKEIKLLLKRERIQNRLEKAYTDPEELADNADYQRVKLEPDQIEFLKLYKLKTKHIEKMPYCYDFIGEFQKYQNVHKPKKILKTPLEEYKFNEMIFDKEIIYPEEVLSAKEHNLQKMQKNKENKEEVKEETQENKEEGKKNENKNNLKDSKVIKENNKTESKDNKTDTKENKNETKDNKTESKDNKTEDKEKKEEEQKEEKVKKTYDPRLYDFEKMELVDYGEESYQRLIDTISKVHGIMWMGKLSPSKCENMFGNYIKIIEKITERKKELREKFEEEQSTEEVKIPETHIKARKQLLNVFVKGNSAYEVIKDNYKMILTGQANPDEMVDEEDAGQDEEQFSHDMMGLIDYYINDDFELINSILKGKHIAGFYGLDRDNSPEKEEEFDPKCIEEITN